MQIEGNKHWYYPNGTELLQDIMTRSDMLYVPAHTRHKVVTGEGYSISLAFIYKPIRYQDIANELLFSKDINQIFYGTLPVYANISLNNEALMNNVEQISESLLSVLNDKAFRNNYIKLAQNKMLSAISSARKSLFAKKIDRDSVWKVNANINYVLESVDKRIILSVQGGFKIEFSDSVENLLRQILQKNSHSKISDLDVTDNVKHIIDVMQALLSVGLINVIG